MTAGATIAVWLGGAAPLRSIRWLDGTLQTAARLGKATAVAAVLDRIYGR